MPRGVYVRSNKVCGVGIYGNSVKSFGVGGKRYFKPEYALWKNIINRCYNENSHKYFPYYAACTVCERWLTFDNFVEDLPNLEGYSEWVSGKDFELDKDLKSAGNKIYSPDLCQFVSSEVNGRDGGKRHRPFNKS